MDEDDKIAPGSAWGWRRRAIVAAIIFCALLLIFHRPVLLALGREVVLHYAAKENLKANLRLEGSVFTNLTIRNLHLAPTGPSAIEAVDVDLARADYSLLGLMRHGLSHFLENVELRSARIVLSPSNAPPPAPKKPPKPALPSIFPERIRIADATLIVRDKPHDLLIEHVDLDLNPRTAGELKIDKLQLSGGQGWSHLSAQTSYANKNLVLQNLVLNDQDRIRLLQIDASKIDAKRLAIQFEAALGEGTISSLVRLNETASSLNANIHFVADKIAADAFNKYTALPEGFVGGDVEELTGDLNGALDSPRTWNGKLSARVNDFHEGGFALDRCVFEMTARDGTANLELAEIARGKNELHLRGSAILPAQINELSRGPANLEVAAAVPDLKEATVGLPQQLTGSAQVNGKIDINNGELQAKLNVSGENVGFEDGQIEKVSLNVSASKTLSKSIWFAGLQSNISLDISKIAYRDYAVDSVRGSLTARGDLVKIEQLNVQRKENQLIARGEYKLPNDFRDVAKQPAKIDISFNAPELGDFWAAESPDKVTGPLQMSGQLEWKNGAGNGRLSIFGANVRVRDLVLNLVNAQCAIANNVVYVNDFTASLNEQDFANGNGIIDLRAPYRYRGKFLANIADLSKLNPLLRAFGNQNELAGSASIDWQGSGEAAKFHNTGKLVCLLNQGRYGQLQSLQANINVAYSPEGLDVPTIFLRSDTMDFQAIVQAKGDSLEITKIQLDQGQAKYASGYVSIPFVWKNLGTSAPVLPPNGKVTATFQSENIDIKKLFENFAAKPAASGVVNVKLDAQGMLADLNARLDIEAHDLRSELLPKLEPASFNLTAEAGHDQLTIAGKLQQTKIQPLELTASLPFNIPKIARKGKLADDTPVKGKLVLPRSSVNFVRQFVPALQELDGDLGLDVDVGGTIAQPVFNGTGDMTINVARATNTTFPALQNFKARLSFARNALNIDRFGGELSGGHFTLTGGVKFPSLTNANLDLHLKADSVLVARNDELTARTDADIRVAGPLTSATVSGTIAMTNSQFLKNLDLIPIGLPGRPAPEPPASRPQFSIPQPPLRDWKFNVSIKTKDPIRLRGSLASGGVVSDLHLGGNGLRPGLQGLVRLENVEATLPFSRLQVNYGFLYFDPSDPLNPKLELHGTSVLQDYTIHVYVYGTSLAPEVVFSSEPPLPQEDIISLLSTGTTRQQLTGSNNVLAGRAATLLVQQLYRKIFKKGEPTQSNSVFNRFSLDVGTVDSRTGQQQATARFKINDQFVLVGDVGVGGEYRGMVKYLIRFR